MEHRWVPPLAVGLILLVDRRIWTDDIPLPIKAAADESAHIATTLCLLPLIRPKRPRDFFAGAIVWIGGAGRRPPPVVRDVRKADRSPRFALAGHGRACRGPHRAEHRAEKRVPARSVVRAREPSLPRPLDRWCARLLAAVRTDGDDRHLGATLAPTPESSRRPASPGHQLRHRVVVSQAAAFPTVSTARSFTVTVPWPETMTLAPWTTPPPLTVEARPWVRLGSLRPVVCAGTWCTKR